MNVSGYNGTYDAVAHGASGTVIGVAADSAAAGTSLDLGESFTNAPGGSANWAFTGGQNYTDQSGSVAIEIAKRTITLTATPQTKVYGSADPALTYSVGSAGLAGSDVVNGDQVRAAGENVGTYSIGQGSLAIVDGNGGNNYALTYVGGHLVITQKALTIGAVSTTKTYDGNTSSSGMPVFTGLVLGNTGSAAQQYDSPNAGARTLSVTSYSVDDGNGGHNYMVTTTTAAGTIDKANANIVVTPYDVEYDTLAHTATGTASGVMSESLAGLNLSGTTHTNAGEYSDTWTFTDVTGNYKNASGTITDKIMTRDATVRFIGQTTYSTSGASATSAQVTLSASVQDPSGVGLVGATVDFVDASSGAFLAKGVKVTPVAGMPSTGTANTIVTLSTGQYGAQSYLIRVVMSGQYNNNDQDEQYKMAVVSVCQPSATNTIIGTGMLADLGGAAGTFGTTANLDANFTVGLKYNKSQTNLQGNIQLFVPQEDGSTIYIKSNSLSSMTITNVTSASNVSGKQAVVYAKATVTRITINGSMTIDGGVTLRMDFTDWASGSADAAGFTVLSSKTGEMYYSNDWYFDTLTKTWKTRSQTVIGSTVVIG